MPRYARFAVADELRAHRRAQAVGADQCAAVQRFAIFAEHAHRAAVLFVAGHAVTGAQIDQFAGPATFEQGGVQIGAMDHRVGIAEAFAELVVERNRCNFCRRQRVHQAQAVDIDRFGTHLFADAEIVETMKRVGAELNPGADFAEFGRALEHD